MEDVFVARVMRSDPRVVDPETPLPVAAETLLEGDVGSVLVVDDRLEGIVTTTDLVRAVADGGASGATVAAAATADVVTVDPQDTVREAAAALTERGIHRLPVVDGAAGVVGVVTAADVAPYLSHVEPPRPQ